jgi:recombinational DNA repair protein RecR
MGVDCSHCKCTNREDEKILIIENPNKEKIINIESRKDKMNSSIEKAKSTNSTRLKVFNLLEDNPNIEKKIIRLQALIKRYRDRKVYKVILKKIRVKNYDKL